MGVLIQKKQAMKACLVFAALVVFAAVATAEFQPGEEEFIETTELRRPGVKGCHLKCKPRQCSVTIYQHCNYRGYRINLKPGSYNMHQLQRKHMKNDDISSIRFTVVALPAFTSTGSSLARPGTSVATTAAS